MNKNILKVGSILLLALATESVSSQVVQKIGDNPFALSPSAVLELESTSKGFLAPRMTTIQRDAIVSRAVGLIIYNITTNTLEVWNGTAWYSTSASGQYIPLSGATMTGLLTLSADPTADLGAATKQYVDTKAPIADPTFTGDAKAVTAAAADNDTSIATTAFVSTAVSNATPDATTLVKGKIQLAGDLLGTADSPSVVASTESKAGKVQLANEAETTTGTLASKAVHPKGLKVELDKKLNLLGGTMTGDLDMGKKNINNISNLVLKDNFPTIKTYVSLYKDSGYFHIYNSRKDTDFMRIYELTGTTEVTSLLIAGGTDNLAPLKGQVATAEDTDGHVVWRTPETTPDATTTVKGKIQLAGDLSGSAASPTVVASTESKAGKVQLANETETTEGTLDSKAVHPKGLKVELDKKAPIAAPTFTGDAKAVTAAAADNDTSIATTAFVSTAVSNATPDATTLVKGKIQLAGDLLGSADSPSVVASTESKAGKVQLASEAETTAGTLASKAVHPKGLKVELDKKLNLLGGTMTGDLSMGLKNISNVGTLYFEDPSESLPRGFFSLSYNSNNFKIYNQQSKENNFSINATTGKTTLSRLTISYGSDNLTAPVAGQIATAKNADGDVVWRDAPSLGGKLDLSGGTMTGDLNMGNHDITNANVITANNQIGMKDRTTTNTNIFYFYKNNGKLNIWSQTVGDAFSIDDATGKTTLTSLAIGKGTDGVAPLIGQVATAADANGNIVWKSATANVADATETVLGKVQLATAAETKAGTLATKAVHPKGLKEALDLKATIADPTFTGDAKAETAAAGDNDTSIATTAFVSTAVSNATPDATTLVKGKIQLAGDLLGSADSPSVVASTESKAGKVQLATEAETTTGTDKTKAVHPAGLKVELDKKAPIDTPTFIGDAKAVTAAAADNDTSIATTAFVSTAVSNATPDATTLVKGKIQLAGDLLGSADSPSVVASTESKAGKVQLANAAETTTGTETTKAVHPAGLKVELDKKANLLAALRKVSANYTVVSTDEFVVCTGNMTLTLPAVTTTNQGKKLTIKKSDQGTTLTFSAAVTYDGGIFTTLNYPKAVTVIADGSTWAVVSWN
ncbi:hypothetical protein ACHRV5_03750 [Flavobacterium sp. FlaQc-52]|jgi:hypothetical protein|uniref:hypothetical protein n=1 Tax=Flavobacterium sp. FlaQc-52 TaxID=3374185 RepID=UPI0037567FD9